MPIRHERGVTKVEDGRYPGAKYLPLNEKLWNSRFEQACAGVSGITNPTRCRILNAVAKPVTLPEPSGTEISDFNGPKSMSRQTSRPFFSQMSAEKPSMDQTAAANHQEWDDNKEVVVSCFGLRLLAMSLLARSEGKVGLKSEKLMTWPSSSPENQSHRVSIPLTLFMLIQILFSMCSLTFCIIIWNNGKGIFFA